MADTSPVKGCGRLAPEIRKIKFEHMKYRLTPGNAFFLFTLGIYIYYQTNPGSPRDALGSSYIFFFSLFVLIGDLLLQLVITNYKKLLFLEFVSLPIIIIITLLA